MANTSNTGTSTNGSSGADADQRAAVIDYLSALDPAELVALLAEALAGEQPTSRGTHRANKQTSPTARIAAGYND
ncbi:hypothetical protein FOS14_18115 [Skermania sp. ID1734]|uniref:hypothetical protein n=1 Tax=Skermania sp. ID1734 TaxID=2597516 RepID=UPI00117F1D6F|nr:hypothetical protein [Skermania sp. ID1734]TSD95281.1 hypothetical protein FOS14_18115 [Skermania sp. ID1734]